jgi:hypothetical protein
MVLVTLAQYNNLEVNNMQNRLGESPEQLVDRANQIRTTQAKQVQEYQGQPGLGGVGMKGTGVPLYQQNQPQAQVQPMQDWRKQLSDYSAQTDIMNQAQTAKEAPYGGKFDSRDRDVSHLMPTTGTPGAETPIQQAPPEQPNLPERNTLPATPGFENIDGQNVPQFDNTYINQNYAGLNDPVANQARFEKNAVDAAAQDKASGAMVERLNRGTAAMKDLREAKYGKGPNLSTTSGADVLGGTGMFGKSQQKLRNIPRQPSLPRKRGEGATAQQGFTNQLAVDKMKFERQKEADKRGVESAKYAADPKNTFNKMIMDNDLMSRYNTILESGGREGQYDPEMVSRFNQASPDMPFETMMRLMETYGAI